MGTYEMIGYEHHLKQSTDDVRERILRYFDSINLVYQTQRNDLLY